MGAKPIKNRVAAGVPTGGQFASHDRAEGAPLLDLAGVDVDKLTDVQAANLLNMLITRQRIVTPIIDEAELVYRLYEEPESYGVDTARLAALEAEHGGRAGLLDALQRTDAWDDFGDFEHITHRVDDAIERSLCELETNQENGR